MRFLHGLYQPCGGQNPASVCDLHERPGRLTGFARKKINPPPKSRYDRKIFDSRSVNLRHVAKKHGVVLRQVSVEQLRRPARPRAARRDDTVAPGARRSATAK